MTAMEGFWRTRERVRTVPGGTQQVRSLRLLSEIVDAIDPLAAQSVPGCKGMKKAMDDDGDENFDTD